MKTLRTTYKLLRKLPFDFEDTSDGRPEAKTGEDAGQPGKPRREEAEQDKGNDGLRALDDAGGMEEGFQPARAVIGLAALGGKDGPAQER
jgi:hypothetical protein